VKNTVRYVHVKISLKFTLFVFILSSIRKTLIGRDHKKCVLNSTISLSHIHIHTFSSLSLSHTQTHTHSLSHTLCLTGDKLEQVYLFAQADYKLVICFICFRASKENWLLITYFVFVSIFDSLEKSDIWRHDRDGKRDKWISHILFDIVSLY